MKLNLILILLLLFVPKIVTSQISKKDKVVYFNSKWQETTPENHKYYRIIKDYRSNQDLYEIKEYYQSGTIRTEGYSKDKDRFIKEGEITSYFENGNIKEESNYIDNNLNGKQLEWYDNAEKKSEKEITWDAKNKNSIVKIIQFWNKDKQQIVIDGNGQYEDTDENFYEKGEIKNGKRQGVWEGKNLKENYSFSETYKDGEFISGISTDKENNKYPYKVIREKPTHKKGMTDFYSFIGKNYRTPSVQELEGKVYITFIVDTDGSLADFKILRDIGYGTGEEAIRVLMKAEKWIPGKMRGMPTKVMYSLPIAIKTVKGNYNNANSTYNSRMIRNTNSPW